MSFLVAIVLIELFESEERWLKTNRKWEIFYQKILWGWDDSLKIRGFFERENSLWFEIKREKLGGNKKNREKDLRERECVWIRLGDEGINIPLFLIYDHRFLYFIFLLYGPSLEFILWRNNRVRLVRNCDLNWSW